MKKVSKKSEEMKKNPKKSKEIKEDSKESKEIKKDSKESEWITWTAFFCWLVVFGYWVAVVFVALLADTETRIIGSQIVSMFAYPLICILVMPYIRDGKLELVNIYNYLSEPRLFVHITHGFIFPSIAVLLSVAFDEEKIKEIGKDTIILSSIYALAYICQTSMFKALLPDDKQKKEN